MSAGGIRLAAAGATCPPPSRRLDVLGELLHCLSQPLTGLRCALENSLEEIAGPSQAGVAAALEQTESVIGMVQLMREYLDAERPGPSTALAELDAAVRSVSEELSTIAEVRGVRLVVAGRSRARVPLPESRLRLALQYLIAGWIEKQSPGDEIVVAMDEGVGGAVLRVEGARAGLLRKGLGCGAPSTLSTTLSRIRLAIAGRLLEGAGVALVPGECGFVLLPAAEEYNPAFMREEGTIANSVFTNELVFNSSHAARKGK
ncbi:MAG: hypothetical protein ACLPHI_20980 [Terriglobales bacterium]|jgi:hypothetical protein